MAKIKTGLTNDLRTWMQKRREPFDLSTVYQSKKLPGCKRQALHWALRSFLRRGEVIKTTDHLFLYNRDYNQSRPPSPVRDRVYKAVYVINRPFTSADIQRLAGLDSISSVAHLLPALAQAGYINQVESKRKPITYRLLSRERFRLELLSPQAPGGGKKDNSEEITGVEIEDSQASSEK